MGFRGRCGTCDGRGEFDLVVVGGGYGGMGAAISAARLGAKVALIQNREVLGGNGSSEVRVWAMGDTPPSEYGLADIVKEIEDDAKASPAPAEQFGDAKKIKSCVRRKTLRFFLVIMPMDSSKRSRVPSHRSQRWKSPAVSA